MIYGIYKKVRNASWDCLNDYSVTALPVDPMAIAKAAGIKVIKNSAIGELSGGESGACILDSKGRWYLIYDDECTVARRRLAIAHELGHIFLGHELLSGKSGRSFRTDKPQAEREADDFAIRLLSPACVLWGLDIRSYEDIARVCVIPEIEAKKRADRMKVLYERQKFLTSPLERKVYEQFRGYIEVNKK